MLEKRSVYIAGGGLVGTLLSIYLSDLGFQVEVFEKRPDPLVTKPEEGRSINLALSLRGIKALQEASLAEEVLENTVAMKGRMIHERNGSLHFLPYGKTGQYIYSVSRALLNRVMIAKAKSSGKVSFTFNSAVTEVSPLENLLHLQEQKELRQKPFEMLFASDGANSAVRESLATQGYLSFRKEVLEHGYKEFHINGENGRHLLEPNALHIWPREKFMLIALPNLDGSFTCTLFLPFKGENSFEELQTGSEARAFFETFFPDTVDLIEDLEQQFESHPLSSLFLVHADPWTINGNILLLGDAAHAIVPFYGQGMNGGFESCRILKQMILDGENWNKVLEEFSRKRKPDADAIGELTMENFIEMRDKVADPEFLLQKKLEELIQDQHPGHYVPLYSMVTFSDLPYSEAQKRGQSQMRLIRDLLQDPEIRGNMKSPAAMEKINKKVNAFFDTKSY